jgi:hypothetical protein
MAGQLGRYPDEFDWLMMLQAVHFTNGSIPSSSSRRSFRVVGYSYSESAEDQTHAEVVIQVLLSWHLYM